jgi:hypothetical protein
MNSEIDEVGVGAETVKVRSAASGDSNGIDNANSLHN